MNEEQKIEDRVMSKVTDTKLKRGLNKPKKKLWLILALVVILLAAGSAGAWYFLGRDKKGESTSDTATTATTETNDTTTVTTNENTTSPATMPDTLLASFDDIRDVVEKDGAKWVATQGVIRLANNKVTWYTQKDGLPGSRTNDIINHNGQIWVGMYGGIARFDESKSKFISYLQSETNVRLFEDPYSKTLYTSTFNGFFQYDAGKDEWIKDTGASAPINSEYIVFTQYKIFGTSFRARPVVIYDKSKQSWEKPSFPEFGDQQGLRLFKANDRVVIFGRGAEYSSCDENGKQPASLFFEWKDDTWKAIDSLNTKFYSTAGPSILETQGNTVTFTYLKSQCDSGEQYKKITADFGQSDVALGNESDFSYNGGVLPLRSDYSTAEQEVTNVLKRSPYLHLKDIDDSGNLFAQTGRKFNSETKFYGFARFKPTGAGYLEEVIIANNEKNPNYIDPIICQSDGKKQLKYILSRQINEIDGEVTQADLYFVDSEFKAALVKNINTDNLKKIPSIISQLQSSSVCNDHTLFWIDFYGKTYKLDLGNGQFTELPSQLSTQITEDSYERYIRVSREDIWFYQSKDKSLYKFDTTKGNVTEVKLGRIASELEQINQLLAVSDKNFWFLNSSEVSETNKQVILTDSNLAEVGTFSVDNVISNLVEVNTRYAIANKNYSGTVVFDRNSSKMTVLDTGKMPFWGYGEVKAGDFSRFDRATYYFFPDSRYQKVWFYTDGGGFFSLSADLIK